MHNICEIFVNKEVRVFSKKMPVLKCDLTCRMWWKQPEKCKGVIEARLEEKDNCHVDTTMNLLTMMTTTTTYDA